MRNSRRFARRLPVCAQVEAFEPRLLLAQLTMIPPITTPVETLENRKNDDKVSISNWRGSNVEVDLEATSTIFSDLEPTAGDFPWLAEAVGSISGVVNGRVSWVHISTTASTETHVTDRGTGSYHEATLTMFLMINGVYDVTVTGDAQVVGDHKSLQTGDLEAIDAMSSNITHISGRGSLYMSMTLWASTTIIDEPAASVVTSDVFASAYFYGMRMTLEVTQELYITNDLMQSNDDDRAASYFWGEAWGTSGSFDVWSTAWSRDATGSTVTDQDIQFAKTSASSSGRMNVDGYMSSYSQGDGEKTREKYGFLRFYPKRDEQSVKFESYVDCAKWERPVASTLKELSRFWSDIFWTL